MTDNNDRRAQAHSDLLAAFGSEYSELSDDDRANLILDLFEVWADGDDVRTYRQNIGRNNLAAYAECIR